MKILFTLFVTAFSLACLPQGQTSQEFIRGWIVTVDASGATLGVPGAKLFWQTNNDFAISADDGSFSIAYRTLPDTLSIKSVGSELMSVVVTGPSSNLTINLTEGKILDGVLVVGENLGKFINLRDPTSIETIGMDELRKAACCNLSEAFETNASVDVNLADAVSGSKKIRMLGLDGVYTQLQWENMPLVRGLSTSYGLNFTPGPWIHSIQITKGTGSVVNGYETMAGLINLELQKPDHGPLFYLNLYGNKFGRFEANVHAAQKINAKWSTMTFAHLANQQFETDVNKDGFRDQPLGYTTAFLHRWAYAGKNSEAQFGFKATLTDRKGGELGAESADPATPKWASAINTEQLELFAKNGYFIKNRPAGSLGLILQGQYHHMATAFGTSFYEGFQRKIYFNAIYSDDLVKDKHSIKTGVSFVRDDYDQWYNGTKFEKTEIVPGAFFEYTANSKDKLIAVLGIRGDMHNMYGFLFAPRLHVKWNPGKKSALRLSTGRGLRVPNPYADNNGLMASTRVWVVDPNLKPEDCISSGITFTQKFLFNNEISSFTADYFYTHFFNAVMADMDHSPQELHLSNSSAVSFSHALQFEFSFKPVKQLELRTAVKFYDVKSEYDGSLQTSTFVPKFRALFNLGYATRNKKWLFDVTANLIGKQRISSTASNPVPYQRNTESEEYVLVNSQLTYNFKRFSVYVGGENLLNVIQKNAIIAADDPFGSYFDATQLWAPINGFNVYAGLHFEIKPKKKEK